MKRMLASWLAGAALLAVSCAPAFADPTFEGHYEWVGPDGYHLKRFDPNMGHFGLYVIVDVTRNRNRWQIAWQSSVSPWYSVQTVSSYGVARAYSDATGALRFAGNDDSYHRINGRLSRVGKGAYNFYLRPVGPPYAPVFTGIVYGTYTMHRYGPVRIIPTYPEWRI